MPLKRIEKNLYILKGGRGDSHVYILDDGDGYILIDTGFSRKIDVVDPRRVKFVFLTHAHYDHIGQSWRFTNIYCSERAFKYILEWDEEIINAGRKDIKIPKFIPTGIVRDEETIRTNNFVLRFIYTPSHTDDSIIIFEERHRWLFTGDVIFALGILGRMDFKNSVRENADRVFRRIISLPWSYLLPGHGPIEKRSIIKI